MGMDAIATPLGYRQLDAASTVAAAAIPNCPDGVQLALIQAEAQALRWRDDGTNPTASVGMLIPAGTTFTYNGFASKVRIINVTAGAIANISLYGR